MALRDQPYFPLYVQDYLSDEKLSCCTLSTQGVYVRLLCVFHKSENYGGILYKQIPKQNFSTNQYFAYILSKQTGINNEELSSAIEELLFFEVLKIEDLEGIPFLFQKRMVKDNDISLKRSISAIKGGGNPKLKKTINTDKKPLKTKENIDNNLFIQNPKQNPENAIEDENENKDDINKVECENSNFIQYSKYGDGRLHFLALEWQKNNEGKYPDEFYDNFLDYWTAPIQGGAKKGKELWTDQKTFSIGGRLNTSWTIFKKNYENNGNTNYKQNRAERVSARAKDAEAIGEYFRIKNQ